MREKILYIFFIASLYWTQCESAETIQVQSEIHQDGSASVKCAVTSFPNPGRIESIEMEFNNVKLAKLKYNSQIEKIATDDYDFRKYKREDYKFHNSPRTAAEFFRRHVVGRFDLKAPRDIFLGVQFPANLTICSIGFIECWIWKENRQYGDLPSDKQHVNLCNNGIVNSTLDMSRPLDPAHFIFTFTFNATNTTIAKLTTVRLRRVVEYQMETVAHIQLPSNGEAEAEIVPNSTFVRHGMTISGYVDQSELSASWLRIESVICEHSGEYVLDVFYTEEGEEEVKRAMAGGRVPNLCDGTFVKKVPSLSLENDNQDHVLPSAADPTSFTATCSPHIYKYGRQLLALELSFQQDASRKRKLLAYGLPNPYLAAEYEARGFRVSAHRPYDADAPDLVLSTDTGTCSDTGVYRCAQTNWIFRKAAMEVIIQEQRKPACEEGALLQYTAHRRTRHQHFMFSLTCSANSSMVSHLISLEISRLHKQHRQSLAFASTDFNSGQAMKLTRGRFRVKGQVSSNSTASFITVSSTVPRRDYLKRFRMVTTCKATFVDSEGSRIVQAMSDGQMDFPHEE